MLSYFDVDPTGKISIASSVIMNKLYLFAATAHKNNILQASVYDISRLEKSKITHLKTFEYTKDDFLNSSEQGPLEFDFNLREAVHFTTRSKNRKDKEGPLEEHHLILSCYNNGLIFFRISSEIPITTEGNDSPILELTFNYPNSGTVNIFSEKAYRNNNNWFTFFTSFTSPPVVIEFRIDLDNNVNLYRTYRSFVDELRYESLDLITSNEKYVAMLIYDNKYRENVIRVFNREETYFAIGHIDIPLKDFFQPITSILFLTFHQDIIFVKNSEKWEVYEIMDSELVIDTMKDPDKYQPWINMTYNITIEACSSISWKGHLRQSFTIRCLDGYNMGAYLTTVNSKSLIYPYNHHQFTFRISEYFTGPDLRFNIDLSPLNYFNDSLVMPIVLNPFEKANITYDYETISECTNNVCKTFEDQATGKVSILISCIKDHIVDQHIFRASDMKEIHRSMKHYKNSKFVGYFRSGDTFNYQKYDEVLMILSHERSETGQKYVFHVFILIDKGYTVWVDKFIARNQGNTLREKVPAIKLNDSPYIALIDKSEKIVIFTSDWDIKSDDFMYKSPKKVKNIYLTSDDFMYFTYSDEKVITRLKFYKYTNQGSSKTLISVEKLGDIPIGYKYHTVDILPNGLSIVFSQNNTIEIFEVQEEVLQPKFHRRLPLFVFKNSTEFWMNEGELDPLYQIADEYLFVIFGQPKYLYVYNLLEHAHNSLVTRMKLDPSYNDLDTYLIIENVKFTSSFYLFVFYGSEKYEVILFEPNNWMLGDIDNESNLFLNQTEIETAFYPDKIVNLTLTPFYANEYPHKEIYSLNLSMNCTNKGLKIQSRHKKDLIEIAQSQENITFSLLDYFDGFNMSYNYDFLQGSENETKIYISKEDHQSYYLNQDTVGRHAKAAFIYNDNDLFVFYSSSTQIDVRNYL